MKNARSFALVGLALMAVACASSQMSQQKTKRATRVEYDRFKDYTSLTLLSTDVPISRPCVRLLSVTTCTENLSLRLIAGWRGDTPTGDALSGILTLTSSSEDWRYLRCHNLNFLVNDKLFATDDATHDGSVGTGYVMEFVSVTLTHDQMMKMGTANKVEGKLCGDVFSLSAAQLHAMREFVSHFTDYVP